MEHIRGTTNQGHSGSIPTCAEDFCNRSEQARRAIEDFKQTPQAYSVLQFRLRVGSTPVVDEFIREAIFGMERALPSGNSLGENMGVLGPVCRWCGGMELHRDGCLVLLLAPIFTQEI